jgi:O-antigen ligase
MPPLSGDRWLVTLRDALLVALLACVFFLREVPIVLDSGPLAMDVVLIALSAAAALVTGWLVLGRRDAGAGAIPRGAWWYVMYLVAVTIAWRLHPDAAATHEYIRQLTFLAVVGSFAHAGRRAPAMWLALVIIGLSLIVVQILGPRSVVDHFGRAYHYRAIPQWSGYPEIGLLACLGVAATWAVTLAGAGWRLRVASALLACGFAAAPLYLYSRFAMITVVAVAAWLPIALLMRARSRIALAVVLLIGVAGAGAIAREASLRARVEAAMAAGAWETGIRAEGWRVAWAMMHDHPWFGVGPGRYAIEYPRYSAKADNTHAYNLLLHVGAELGALGLACYGLLWGRVVWRSLWATGRSPSGLAALATHGMLLAFFLRSQSEHFLANLDASFRFLILLALFFGLAEGVTRQDRLPGAVPGVP